LATLACLGYWRAWPESGLLLLLGLALPGSVTPDLLSRLLGLLSAESHSGRALRAALALGFFGLMRAGEFTYKGPDSTLLLRRHVTWRPAHVEVFLPTSKTDRAGRGVVIRLFPSGNALFER
jgi:hypothetical protein